MRDPHETYTPEKLTQTNDNEIKPLARPRISYDVPLFTLGHQGLAENQPNPSQGNLALCEIASTIPMSFLLMVRVPEPTTANLKSEFGICWIILVV